MKNPPQDLLDIMDELPQSVLDEIHLKLMLCSFLEYLKLGPKQPTYKAFEGQMNKLFHIHEELLRDAYKRHVKEKKDS